jgi:Cu+-exporting ATPase
MSKDPVCGMDVNESQAKAKTDYKGQTYYFCSDSCKQKFEKNPQQYAKKTA